MADDDKAKKEEEPTYHVDRLIPESDDRFGVPSHVAAGAFAQKESKKNYTLDEAAALIEKFETRKVPTDNAIETSAPGEEE